APPSRVTGDLNASGTGVDPVRVLGSATPQMTGMSSHRRVGQTGDVLSTLTAERVRRDLDVLAHAGLDLETFVAEMDASLNRAVPHEAGCYALLDPATHLLTGTYKAGDLMGRDERDHEWGLVEYGDAEEVTFASQVRDANPAVGMHLETEG